MSVVRHHQQTIIASVNIKLTIEQAKELSDLLLEKINGYKNGADRIGINLEGRFT